MRFGAWYPLDEAARHAPREPGVYQIRVREGLLDYPTGKSAMVFYGSAENVREAAEAIARERDPGVYLCRHAEDMSAAQTSAPGAVAERLIETFARRFGSPPRWPAEGERQ